MLFISNFGCCLLVSFVFLAFAFKNLFSAHFSFAFAEMMIIYNNLDKSTNEKNSKEGQNNMVLVSFRKKMQKMTLMVMPTAVDMNVLPPSDLRLPMKALTNREKKLGCLIHFFMLSLFLHKEVHHDKLGNSRRKEVGGKDFLQ